MTVHAFPPRRIEPAPEPARAEPFPAPEVTSIDPIPEKVPAVVSALIRLAEQRGWSVQLTYSRGYEPHALYGTPSAKVKTKWALRMVRGEQRAVAVRTDSAWTSLWTWSSEHFFRESTGLREFERELS